MNSLWGLIEFPRYTDSIPNDIIQIDINPNEIILNIISMNDGIPNG